MSANDLKRRVTLRCDQVRLGRPELTHKRLMTKDQQLFDLTGQEFQVDGG